MKSFAKEIQYILSNVKGGMNTADPASGIRDDQIQYGTNIVLKNAGWERAPGMTGISAAALFSASLKGFDVFEATDGTETLLACSGGKVYSINAGAGTKTELIDIGGTGQAYFKTWLGKAWMCNGTDVVKIESSSVAYKVGIQAPSGVAAAAAAGGTLPDGVYQLYASYARKVSGSNVLYSKGQLIASVTCGTGNNTIAITNFANSADAQVNNKVIWATDAGGSTHYFYYETGNNTTTSFNITSNAAKVATILYLTSASTNDRPPAFTHIHFHGGRLWGCLNNTAYFSYHEGNVYDMERFDTASNLYALPWNIIGMFTIDKHLYFNTTGGIVRIPYGDPTAQYEVVDSRWYFRDMTGMDIWNVQAIGLTTSGFRTFNGERFSDVDLGRDVRPDISKAISGTDADNKPCVKVIRRSYRAECQFSYRDLSIGSGNNNRKITLNLDGIGIVNNLNYAAPWDPYRTACISHIVQVKDGTVYYGQSNAISGNICIESGTSTSDSKFISAAGAWTAASTEMPMLVRSKTIIPEISANVRWQQARVLARLAQNMTIRVVVFDVFGLSETRTVQAALGNAPLFDEAVFDVAIFPDEEPVVRKVGFGRKIKGRAFYFEFAENSDDFRFLLLDSRVYGTIKRTRFT